MLVMGLVLGQSLMAISTMDILLYAKVSLLITNYLLLQTTVVLCTSGKNHFHEMNGDVGMAGWK